MTPLDMIGKPARIRPEADCEAYWNNQHDRRAHCVILRDQQTVGVVEQANDWGCFVAFAGQDGHWFPRADLAILD